MDPKQLMREAIRLSREGMTNGDGGPFGAVVVKDGKIVGRGWNRVLAKTDPTAHAEVEAIRDACASLKNFDLSGAEIYTSCEPCPMCLAAIYWARIGKIHYGNTRADAADIEFDDNRIYEEIPKKLEDRDIPMHSFLRDEAQTVFQEWKNKTDKTRY